jgi:arylsulfatase A-like enzyme
VGVAAAYVQGALLRYGALSNEQHLLVVGFCSVAGVVLALAGDSLGGVLARRSSGLLPAALATPVVGFAVFVPLNLRDLPDVYLLVTDTTRADHLSLYGYERSTTPFLEELAAGAAVFTSSVSQGSHTIVSTPSILASVYPSEHGMSRYSEVLPEKLQLASEYLKGGGYQTYGYATNPHLAPDRGYARGFDTYTYGGRWQHAPARAVNQAFVDWLDERDPGPVFAFLFYLDPHSPYAPPDPYPLLFDEEWKEDPVTKWDPEWGVPEPDSPRLRNLVAQYDGAIAYWDEQLRQLVGALEARGRFANAILVYTSDHGEEFFEHGHWGHNRTLFEESTHVPLLVSFPAPVRFPSLPRAAAVIPDVASSVDVLPTILDYVGIEPGTSIRGRSLVPLVFGTEPGPERTAYCEEILHSYGPYDLRAIRTRSHKYVRVLDYEGDRTGSDLFFDLDADPLEQASRLEADSPEAARLRDALEARLAEMKAVGAPQNETTEMDPGRLEQLRALGYVGEED